MNPHLFLSASEDGLIRAFDLRTDLGVVSLVQNDSEFNDVVYHPQTPDVFAVSDSGGHVRLLDARTAFADEVSFAGEVSVRNVGHGISDLAFAATYSWCLSSQYATTLASPTKKALITAPLGEFDTSSLTFSPSGRLLCTTVSKYLPTLYDTSDELPIATFSSGPSHGGPGYSNLCTVKVSLPIAPSHVAGAVLTRRVGVQHGSFGGTDEDLYFSAGSDDFGAYVWSVPPVEVLKSRRRDPWKDDAMWPTEPNEPSWIGKHELFPSPRSLATTYTPSSLPHQPSSVPPPSSPPNSPPPPPSSTPTALSLIQPSSTPPSPSSSPPASKKSSKSTPAPPSSPPPPPPPTRTSSSHGRRTRGGSPRKKRARRLRRIWGSCSSLTIW